MPRAATYSRSRSRQRALRPIASPITLRYSKAAEGG
jgi:hypothetical protein